MFVTKVAQLLELRKETLATVESCTGGGIAASCTSISGSSQWFQGGWVTYSNDMKVKLGVPIELIEQYGAVSSPVAASMAQQGLLNTSSDWAISVTGIAGPGGGSAEKPVGTVWFGIASKERVYTYQRRFAGNREAVRESACAYALEQLALYLR